MRTATVVASPEHTETMWSPLILLCFLLLTHAQPKEDNITSLPGVNFDLNYQQYSGYLDLANGHHLHYWLTLSQNKPYPNDDPLVLWLNGGPGCSSLDGMLYEQGPIHVTDNGTLYSNPYAWNTVANVLFLEAPVCVGFSYSDDGICVMDDNTTADDNYDALLQFFIKFPAFAKNEFFVTGESYGGVYVPTLTRRILIGNAAQGSIINLRGFAVGNGLSSDELNTDSSMWYAYHHGLIDSVTWDVLLKSCCTTSYTRQTCPFASSKNSECKETVSAVMELLYNGDLNWYNIYGDCLDTKFSYQKYLHELSWIHRGFHESNGFKYIAQLKGNVPCLDTTGGDVYLNREDVKRALHISSKVTQPWSICSDTLNYTDIYDDLSKVYRDIFKMSASIYGLVYNGDTDLSCNLLGDQWFVDDLGFNETRTYREWYYSDERKQVAGFTKDFDRISFVTVRGSGHMVPQYKPLPALNMFEAFLQHKPL
eukprot:61583_1